MEKSDRLNLICSEEAARPPHASAERARMSFADVMNGVEDTRSGVPYRPDRWMEDGRLYPPHDDSECASPHPHVRIFRARGHYIHFAANGAIRIRNAVTGAIVFDKPGVDGRLSPY